MHDSQEGEAIQVLCAKQMDGWMNCGTTNSGLLLSLKKKKDILTYATIWMKDTMLSETSQSLKKTFLYESTMKHLE